MKSLKEVASLIQETLCKDGVSKYSSVVVFMNISENSLEIKFGEYDTVDVNGDENLIPLVYYGCLHGFWKDVYYKNDEWILTSCRIASDCVDNMILFGCRYPREVRVMIFEFLIRELKNFIVKCKKK